jgi:polyisoprenoid-binding protein YceI
MMQKSIPIFIIIVSLMLSFSFHRPINAGELYSLDKSHTQIKFSVNRGGWTRITGWFEKFDGSINFDQENVTNSSVNAIIQTGSINTGFARRDAHLRSPDFFSSKEFPTIKFKSSSIEKTGNKSGKMTGNLTMLGVTKPITLEVVFNRKANHPRNNRVFSGFTAQGKLNRSDFGMNFILRAVSDEVLIKIEALAVKG